MKKLFFAVVAIAVMSSFTSCKKCGHCEGGNGNQISNNTTVCKDNSLGPLVNLDNYAESEAQCKTDGGKWIKD